MSVQMIFNFPIALVLLLNFGGVKTQDPTISITSTEVTVRSESTFQFNCTVSPYNSDWMTEIVKTMFEVTTPGGDTYTLNGDGWPMSIAQDGDVDATVRSEEGNRYTASFSAMQSDDMTLTSVMISSTKPEDSGMWSCRVLQGGSIIKNATDMVNLQVDGPIRSVMIYVDATSGSNVFANQTLSDGVDYTFMHGSTYRLTCEVGVPSSTAPTVAVTITDNMGNMKEVTDDFKEIPENPERSTSEAVKAGGRVRHTAHISKVNKSFQPNVADHGKMFNCDASLQGYPNVNASFTLNIESMPQITCPKQIAALVATQNPVVECTILANPPVSMATWLTPSSVPANNITVTNDLTGIMLKTSLKISEVTKDHYGKYNVTATNVHGTAVVMIDLTDRIVSSATVHCFSVLLTAMMSLPLLLALH